MLVWLFGLLVAFNLVSCVAQFLELWKTTYKANIPFLYLCFNIYSARDQANLSLWYAADVAKKSRSPGDHLDLRSQEWMNLSRIATVWLFFAFVQCFTSVTFSSIRLRYKIPLIVIYVHHVWNTFIPLVLGNPHRSLARAFANASPQLLLYIDPSIVFLGLSIIIGEDLTTLDSTGTPLSLAGIASQIAVHGIVAMSWALMVGAGLIRNWSQLANPYWPTFAMLWNRFLWPVVDNGIFAVLQGKLLWVAIRGRKATSKEGRHKLQAVNEATLPLTV